MTQTKRAAINQKIIFDLGESWIEKEDDVQIEPENKAKIIGLYVNIEPGTERRTVQLACQNVSQEAIEITIKY